MSLTIRSGGAVTKDPDSAELFIMDWDTESLEPTVTIASSAWAISGGDSSTVPLPATALAYDNGSILTGNRKTQLRLKLGTLGRIYTVTNTIVTNESPAQTIDASFKALVQQA